MNISEKIKYCDEEKVKIISSWIDSESVKDMISQHNLDIQIIRKRYAFIVWNYYKNLLNKNEQTHLFIYLIDFIKYLKKHSLKSYELFSLFSEFKNSVLKFCFQNNLDSLEIIEEIINSYEKMFSKVLEIHSKSAKDLEKALTKSVDIVDKYVIMSRTNEKGYITSVSSAFCDISGFKAYELIGKEFNFIKYSDKEEKIFEEILKTVKTGNIWQGKLKNCKKNGTYYWVKTTIHPNFDNMGSFIGFDTIYQDITAQVEFEKQQTLLIEQSKSAAMGEMISMIAHQWRQPLQAVSILVQKLSLIKVIDGQISDKMLDEVVEQVVSQLDYMSKTIDDFRDYFKPDKKKEKVYIQDIINKALDFLDYMFKVNLVKVNYNNNFNSQVKIYFNEIIQVLINLSKNSIDAMIDNNIQNRIININTFEENGFLIIELEDNAGGIKDDIISKIFDPYFSTKDNKNGTGLGLYMSKQIIKEHSQGDILVQNTKMGSKFTVKLPLN